MRTDCRGRTEGSRGRLARLVRARGGAEGPVHGAPQFVHQEHVRQGGVGELRVTHRETHAVQRVVAQPAGLGEGRSGGGERVPGTRRRVSFPVLHGVQQMGQPPEEPSGLGERRRVLRLAREHGGVREGAAVAVSVGSVTVSSGVPGPASDSIPVCRSTASTRTAVSKPSSAPVRAPALSQPAATRRAAAATGRRFNSPSRSATWSRTFADASTSDTAAASLAPSRGRPAPSASSAAGRAPPYAAAPRTVPPEPPSGPRR